MRKPVFLDRDGVINHDHKPYIVRAEQIELLPTAAEGLAKLYHAGFELYVVSNQQGVAKGFIPEEELPRMSERIRELVRPLGVEIRHFEYCTAMEGDGNPCRKPSPGMIHHIASLYGLDLDGCYLIGDRWSDIEAGSRAGLRTVLILTGVTSDGEWLSWNHQPEAVFPTLEAAAVYVIERS